MITLTPHEFRRGNSSFRPNMKRLMVALGGAAMRDAIVTDTVVAGREDLRGAPAGC